MKYKAFSFLFICIISVFISKGQDNRFVDSLEAALKVQKNDTNKIKTINALAWEYSSINLKRARNYCNNAIELATKLNFYKGRSSAYNSLGNIASDEAKSDEALKYYFLAVKDKERIHDEKGLATVYSNIGIIYKIKGDYGKAVAYYTKALSKRELLGDKKGVGDCYNNIGNVYRCIAQFKDALIALNKALEIRRKIGDNRGVAFALNNIANVYDDQSDFVNALQYNYKSALLLEKEKDKGSLILVYNNISLLNKKLKNYPNAIRYGSMSLALSIETGNKMFGMNAYEAMGEVYIEMKIFSEAKRNFEKGMLLAKESDNREMESNFYVGLGLCNENNKAFNEAEINYKKAVELAKEIGTVRDVARFSNNLAEFYCKQSKNDLVEALLNESIEISKKHALKNDLKKAYKVYAEFYQTNLNELSKSIEYYKLYSKLNDSLFSEDIAEKFAVQQIRYETEKKEAEIKILKQKEEIRSLQLKDQSLLLEKRKYLLIVSAISILLICIAGYLFFSKQKIKSFQKQEQLIREAEEKERMRMAKDIHDDLGSGLSKIKVLSEIISAKASQNPEIKAGIQSISETAVSLVDNMRDLIWALNPENTTLESLVARIREYSSDYLNDFPLELLFDVNEDYRNRKITKEAHRNIFFILKECLQNIVKHSGASVINLKIDGSKDEFHLVISDNGKGIVGKGNEKGNGMRNMVQRVEVIGGRVDVKSPIGKGLTVEITVAFKNIEKT